MESIFVQIAAYHDYELPKTIIDAIKKSSGKTQINFGVHTCSKDEKEMFIPPSQQKFKITRIHSTPPNNIGIGIGRYKANSLYDGENYYFQTDSHMRFEKNWDLKIISFLKEYVKDGIEKPVISAYPASYYYNDSLKEIFQKNPDVTKISFKNNTEQFSKLLIPTQLAIPVDISCERFIKSFSGAVVFSTGDISQIKPNKIAGGLNGEEILFAARAFTHGFIPVLPKEQLFYHLYYNANNSFQKNNRRLLFQDYEKEWVEIDKKSIQEVKNIFENKIISDQALGKVRTLENFGNFAGLDFKNKKIVPDNQ